MTPRRSIFAVLVAMLAAAGCTDEIPTSGNDNLIPGAETFELLVPYGDFVSELQVFGGFASAEDLAHPPVAHQYRGELEASALVRIGRLPAAVPVTPPGGGSAVNDSAYVVTGGTLVLRMDTVRVGGAGTIEVAAETLQTEWHAPSATWTHAVDTLGDRRSWDEPGGGPAPTAGVGTWDPTEGDSVFVQIDSATAARWADREDRIAGVRVTSRTPDTFLRLRAATFRADVRSEVNPDTTLLLAVSDEETTVIYSPEPGVTPSEIRIGGAPARRAFFRIDPPRRIEAGSPLCENIPCPLDITPDRVVYAGLVLRTTATEPSAFQLLDPLSLDARPALAPDRIPRSPLGSPVQPAVRTLQPAHFGEDAGARVEIPLTRYLRDLLGADGSEGAEPIPNTLVLFAGTEPSGIPFATFEGEGTEGEPLLRIILTVTEGVQLP